MKKLYVQKIRAALLVLIIAALSLNGCKKGNSDTKQEETTIASEASAKEAIEIMEQETVEAESDAEPVKEVKYSIPNEAVSSRAIVFDNNVYFIGTYEISRMEIGSGEYQTLWKSDAPYSSSNAYGTGKGVLLYDKIYFYSEIWEADEWKRYLQVIDVNGDNYSLVATYDSEAYATGDMYYYDGILYVDGNGVNDCYAIDELGNITKELLRADIAELQDEDNVRTYIDYIYESGHSRYSLPEAIKSGKVVIYGDGEQMLRDMKTGREIGLGGHVVASNDSVLLVCDEQHNNHIYGTISLKSGEYKYLLKADKEKDFIAIDEKYAYCYDTDNEPNTVFSKINLTNGKESEIYKYEVTDSRLGDDLFSYFPPVKAGDYLLLPESHDFALYLEAVKLDDDTVTVADECYYDSGISKIGKLVIKREECNASDGEVVTSAYMVIPNLDSKFAGSKAINDILNKQGNVVFELLNDNKDECLDLYNPDEENNYFYPYSFDIRMSEDLYFDGHILSFYLSGYDYYGGAHGMPYRCPYVFNVDTGKQYKLSDVVTISEEEMVEMIKSEFLKPVEAGEAMYWEEDTVTEAIDRQLSLEFENFYFTEKGVLFYFYPYELAAFAEGFPEVTIPYEKLGIDLKALASGETEETEEESTEE